MGAIALNARFHVHRPTGMQRYAVEVSRRFASHLDPVRPAHNLRGIAGHLWEQLYLPTAVRGRLLWSPNNTGPIAVSKHVCTIHDLIPLDHPEWFSPRFSSWYRWLMPQLARRIQHIVAISEFTKQRVVELLRFPENRITVIPNGVDESFHPRHDSELIPVLDPLGIRPRSYVLTVGSLEPRKNLRCLIDAWRKIYRAVPDDIELVIAGAAGNAQVFRSVEFGDLPPRVRFTGYVSDAQLPCLYAGALVFAYPSLYEGFGLPPLEAMASGTPVVTSRGSSLEEVVGPDAILTDPRDPHSIAEGLLEALSRPALRDALRRRGLERAREFTWDRTARETLRVLLDQSRA